MGAGRGDVLSGVSGIAVHDNWASYGRMDGVVHALCNAHHLRELQALVDIEKEPWASSMQTVLLDAKKAAETVRQNSSDTVAANVIEAINKRYDACLTDGLSFHESQPPLKPTHTGKGVIPIWRRFCAANSILQIMLRAHLARPLFGCHLRILVASIGRRGSGAVPWRSMLYRSVRI